MADAAIILDRGSGLGTGASPPADRSGSAGNSAGSMVAMVVALGTAIPAPPGVAVTTATIGTAFEATPASSIVGHR